MRERSFEILPPKKTSKRHANIDERKFCAPFAPTAKPLPRLARAQEYIHLNRNGEWRVNSRAKFIKTLHPPSYSLSLVWLTVQKAASERT